MTTIQDNKNVIKQFFAAFDKNDFDACEKMCAPTLQAHFADWEMDLKGYRQYGEMYRKAFMDLKCNIEFQVAEGDLVVTYIRFDGTQRGELMGIAPTNKRAITQGVNIQRVQNGKIVEVWGLSDGVQLLTQLGQTQLPKMPPQAKKTGQGYVQPHN